MDIYREHIIEHAQNPRHKGLLDPCDLEYEDDNPLCGDYLHITLRVDEEGTVTGVGWDGKGCAISQASASMLTEDLVGRPIAEVQQMQKEDILELLGISLTPNRLKCALLSLKVLKAAAYQHKE